MAEKPKFIHPLSLSPDEVKRLGGLLPPNGRMTIEVKRQENQLRIIRLREDPDTEADTNVDVIELALHHLYRHRYAPPMAAATQIKAHEKTIRDLRAKLERMERGAARVPEAPPSVKAETSTAEEPDEDARGLRLSVAEENIAAALDHLRGIGWDIPDGCNIADAAEIVAQRIDWQRAAREDEKPDPRDEERAIRDLMAENERLRAEPPPSEMEAANDLVSSIGIYPAGADRAECLRDLQHRYQALREENERLRADLTAHGEAADVAEGDLRREVADLTAQRDQAARAHQRAMDAHRLIRLASDSALGGE